MSVNMTYSRYLEVEMEHSLKTSALLQEDDTHHIKWHFYLPPKKRKTNPFLLVLKFHLLWKKKIHKTTLVHFISKDCCLCSLAIL